VKIETSIIQEQIQIFREDDLRYVWK